GGNVGIGNMSPASLLYVGGGTVTAGPLPGLNVALGGASYVTASDGTRTTFLGADASGSGIVGTLSNSDLVLRSNNTERIRILASGNVGMGTTTPSQKLDVYGNVNVSGPAGSGNIYVSGNINAKYQDVAEWVPSSEK